MIIDTKSGRPTIEEMIAAFPLSSLVIGPGAEIVALNAGAEQMFGRAAVGRHFTTTLRHPSVVEAVEQCLQNGTSRNLTYQVVEYGNDVFYAVHVQAVAQSDLILLTFQNRTEMERAEQMRRDFVSNVSHELRTPLTAMTGFIETLRGSARGDAAAAERFLTIMASEADRMNRLVDSLLSLSRVESRERMRPTLRFDLRDVLRTAGDTLTPVARDRNVTLRFDAGSQPVQVKGDADQLLQVFLNLIENAIKYGDTDQVVSITAQAVLHDPVLRGPAIAIEVADRGRGVDPIHLPRLTERFYRADDHRSRALGGSGLGLAIVKHILNRHRGRLKIASQPGEGSQFTVILPVGDDRDGLAGAAPA